VSTYRDQFAIAQANLDNVLTQYETYLSTHPWGRDKTIPIDRVWTAAHCTDPNITLAPSDWSAGFCNDPLISNQTDCVGTYDNDGDGFNGTTPDVPRVWSNSGMCSDPYIRTESQCHGNVTLPSGDIYVIRWITAGCSDITILNENECTGSFTINNQTYNRFWTTTHGQCSDPSIYQKAQCTGNWDNNGDKETNGTLPIPRVWTPATPVSCKGHFDHDNDPNTVPEERIWIDAHCNDASMIIETQCVGQYDHDGDGGTADVPRVWNGHSCNDASVTIQSECTGNYDDDEDGAGHPVFANYAVQIAALERTRDVASSYYDPFRGRGAIPTKSSLGDYYATTDSNTLSVCRGFYFTAGDASLPVDSNTVYFIRFFPRVSDTAAIATMGLEAIGIIFKDVIQPALPSLTHNVIRKTGNKMMSSFIKEIRSNEHTCKEPEKRYEADGKTPYLIRWGEDQHHLGDVTYSWFASLANDLVNTFLSPNTAQSADSNLNTILASMFNVFFV